MQWGCGPLDLEWLSTFLAAADTLSFREVARRRFVSQATVSQQVAHLESAVGYSLFQRVGRRVVLTPDGERFRVYAARLVALWDDAARPGGTRARSVAVGAEPLLAETVLPWLARGWLSALPGLDLVVRVGTAAELTALRVDAALLRQPSSDPAWLVEPLWTEPVALYVGPDGRDFEAPRPDPEQVLTERRLLLDGGAPYNRAVLALLARSGFSPRTLVVDHMGAVKRLVAEGLGAAVLPLSAAFREAAEGRLLEVPMPCLESVRDPVLWAEPYDAPGLPALALARQLLRRRRGASPSG